MVDHKLAFASIPILTQDCLRHAAIQHVWVSDRNVDVDHVFGSRGFPTGIATDSCADCDTKVNPPDHAQDPDAKGLPPRVWVARRSAVAPPEIPAADTPVAYPSWPNRWLIKYLDWGVSTILNRASGFGQAAVAV
jgi:hypothetical protein